MSITDEIFSENPPTSRSSDVFNRLFQDSSKRQQSKQTTPQEAPKAESKGPRNKIEDDLMQRHAILQAKLRKKRAEYNAEQDKEITGTPQINSASKKIAQGEKIKQQEVIKPKSKKEEIMPAVVTNLRKSVRRPTLHSAASASVLFQEESPEKVDVVVNLSKFQMTLEEEQEEKIKLQAGQEASSPNGIPYESVNERMSLNEKLETDEESIEEPKYLEAEKDVVKRAMYWHTKKQERIEKERKEKHAKELDGCTFTPVLNPSRSQLNMENRSEISRSESYSQIFELKRELENEDLPREPKKTETFTYRAFSPSKTRLGYQSGFNLQSFTTRAKPMLDYKSLN